MFGRIAGFVIALVATLSSLNIAHAENTLWLQTSEKWVVFRSVTPAELCRAVTRNDEGRMLDIRVYKRAEYAIAISGISVVKEQPVGFEYIRNDGSKAQLLGVATSSTAILLKAEIEDLVQFIGRPSIDFPYGGAFNFTDAKDAISEAIKCRATLPGQR